MQHLIHVANLFQPRTGWPRNVLLLQLAVLVGWWQGRLKASTSFTLAEVGTGERDFRRGVGHQKKKIVVQICSFWDKTNKQSLMFRFRSSITLNRNFVWRRARERPDLIVVYSVLCFEITLWFVLRAVIRAVLAAFLSCPPVCYLYFIFCVFYGQTRNAWQSLANSPLGATVSPPSK